MKPKITIAIAEDHALLRDGTISILEKYDEFTVLFGAENGKDLMNKLETSIPDILLLDITMPVMDGMEALELIKIHYPQIKVIMHSSHYNRSYIKASFKAGAVAFLSKNCLVEEMIETIKLTHQNGFFYNKFVQDILDEK